MSTEDYFSDWRDRQWACSQCEWIGRGSEATQELFAELLQVDCPRCDARLTLIPLPTNETILRAAAANHPEALAMMDSVGRWQAFQVDQGRSRRKLKDLGTIVGTNLEFSLTTLHKGDAMNPSHVLLWCNGKEIYREPSGYEHWEAVIEIGSAIVDQFGERVAWFDPGAAGAALLGDDLGASGRIQDFLNGAGIAPPSGPWAANS